MPTGLPQPVPVSEGGTGAKTASAAKSNLGLNYLASAPLYGGTLNIPSGRSFPSLTPQTFAVAATGVNPAHQNVVQIGWDYALDDGLVVAQYWAADTDLIYVTIINATGSLITSAHEWNLFAAVIDMGV